MLNQLRNDPFYSINRNSKPDPRISSAGTDNCSIHADHAALGIEQWSARVARVNCGIGLDDIADCALRRRLNLTAEGTHNSNGQCLIQTEWISDREDLLTYNQFIGRPDI